MSTRQETVPVYRVPPPHKNNDILGHLLYLVTAHQFLHILVWATNANQLIPVLSYLFPGNIDGNDLWLKEVYKFEYFPMILHNLPLLLLLFAHHSIFARNWLQQKIIDYSSRGVERTLYVLASTFLTQYVMQTWRPMPHEVWSLSGPLAFVMHALCAFGFFWTALSCLTIAHNDIFKYREAFGGPPPMTVPRHLPLVYEYSRQPMWFGMMLSMWAAADMSIGRLLFATFWTVYTWIAGHMHERDLKRTLGKEYEDYQQRVPFLIPGTKWLHSQ